MTEKKNENRLIIECSILGAMTKIRQKSRKLLKIEKLYICSKIL